MATYANITFEVDNEHHVNWFDTTCARSTADFHSGAASLLTTVTAQFAGVILDNGPASFTGFTGGSSYDFSIWAKEAAATMPDLDWELTWYNGGGTSVGTDNITIPAAGGTWTQATATKVAPTGAVSLSWAFEDHGNGNTGAAWYLDDIVVQDTGGGGGGTGPPGRPPIVMPSLAATQAASW